MKIYLSRNIKSNSKFNNLHSKDRVESHESIVRNEKNSLDKKNLSKKIVDNTPIKLLPFNEVLWERVFPRRNLSDEEYKKLQMTNVGLYSVTRPKLAIEISNIIKSYLPDKKGLTITDATGNTGGNSFAFYDDFDKVNTVEINKQYCKILENNFQVYKMTDKINIICKDFNDAIKTDIEHDAIFFDPPWGGVDYKKNLLMNLNLGDFNMDKIIMDIKENKQKSLKKDQPLIIALRVPYNYDFKRMFKIHDKINIHSFFKDNKVLSSVLICITL